MQKIIAELIELISDQRLTSADIISWGAPIPSFGDPSTATVATLGLNPSNKEFVDGQNQEIRGAERRFHTLASLGISSWSSISEKHLSLIENSCTEYFLRNPYNNWFKALDAIICGTSTSYYNKLFHAVHLDLIPFATHKKWASLNNNQKRALLEVSSDTLGKIINKTPIRILILNGRTVVENFERIASHKLTAQHMTEWDLNRNGIASVKGISYKGLIKRISNIELETPILALGFNHNIQSSFGVSSKVRSSISDWIGKESIEVIK